MYLPTFLEVSRPSLWENFILPYVFSYFILHTILVTWAQNNVDNVISDYFSQIARKFNLINTAKNKKKNLQSIEGWKPSGWTRQMAAARASLLGSHKTFQSTWSQSIANV